jgi:tripartite-type tricarboxylate transporter receptor subunit TctC
MPNVPTFVEVGYKELVTGSWYAVWLPAKTPEAVLSRLHTELVRIVNLPDVRNRIVELGAVPVGQHRRRVRGLPESRERALGAHHQGTRV